MIERVKQNAFGPSAPPHGMRAGATALLVLVALTAAAAPTDAALHTGTPTMDKPSEGFTMQPIALASAAIDRSNALAAMAAVASFAAAFAVRGFALTHPRRRKRVKPPV